MTASHSTESPIYIVQTFAWAQAEDHSWSWYHKECSSPTLVKLVCIKRYVKYFGLH